jgi:hypothetical protein
MIEEPGPNGSFIRTIVAPKDWAICNGSHAPSLIGKFLRGGKVPGETGGAEDHETSKVDPREPTYPYKYVDRAIHSVGASEDFSMPLWILFGERQLSLSENRGIHSLVQTGVSQSDAALTSRSDPLSSGFNRLRP